MTTLSISVPVTTDRANMAVGVLAALGFVSIWSAWIVGTRHAVTHDLDPFAVGFLRFAVPATIFAPLWMRMGLKPGNVGWPTLAGLMGSGAPFFICVATAMKSVAASSVGPLLTGSMPVIVALLTMIVFRERFNQSRLAGLLLVTAGIMCAAYGSAALAGGSCAGQLLLLGGACMWAVYTLAYKRSGLDAFQAVALVSVWSTLLLAPIGIPALVSAWQDGLGQIVLSQALIQGILSGVVAIVLYGVAVARLGASAGAAFVALVPPLAALIGIPMLHEWPANATIVSIAATTVGVDLLAGALPLPECSRGSCRPQ